MKMKLYLSAIFFSVAALAPSNGSALTLHARAYNQEWYTGTPVTPVVAVSLQDGDFTIIDHDEPPPLTLLGDGVNDRTSWIFNFQSHYNYISSINNPITSAKLILQLTSKDTMDSTDGFRLDAFPGIGGCSDCVPIDSNLFNLTYNQLTTVEIDLLKYYSSDQIKGLYNTTLGLMPAQFADDCIVSQAYLGLKVPEPVSMLLFSTGLAGLFGCRIKRKRK